MKPLIYYWDKSKLLWANFKNRHKREGWYLIFILFILVILSFNQIVGFFSDFENSVNYVTKKISPKQTLPPEPPVYIIKTRVENIPLWTSPKLSDKPESYKFGTRLYDDCGDIDIQLMSIPKNTYQILKGSDSGFLRTGQENLTYSISTFTDRRNGVITLRVKSDTKFEVQKKESFVKKTGESKEIEGLYEELYDIDLSLIKETHQNLFDLVPEQDKEITINCLKIDNCGVLEKTSSIYYFGTKIKTFIMNAVYADGGLYQLSVNLPERNFSKISVYELKNWTEFIKISLENSTNATTVININPSQCNKEGKVYLRS